VRGNMDDHIGAMARPSHRDRILTEGLRVVHERGFAGASVRDIVRAAGVPQGSFTNHFGSKEAFGLEVLDLYFRGSRSIIDKTLLNGDLKPLDRLAAYVDANRDDLSEDGMRNGCLLGNFAAEVVDQSEALRMRLVAIFSEMQAALVTCLTAACAAGDLRKDLDLEGMALLIVSSLQGAILLAKAERDPRPVDNFKTLLFATLIR
jgi:TetR/AcrR family transcriptional repressor of nem operon